MGLGYKNCDKCHGTGQWVAPISRYGASSRCPDCGGQGSVRIPDDECQEISGPHNFQLVDKDNDEGPIRCVDCGETRGDDMESKERLAGDFAEAAAQRKLIDGLSNEQLLAEVRRRHIHGNMKIRQVSSDGQYRVVAPDAREDGNSRFYVNNRLVIERSSKNALGEPSWEMVGEPLVKNLLKDTDVGTKQLEAIFRLLADSDR